jgi:mannose-6-phosphate isomerase-like protein (cupin superfamily)
VNGTTSEGYVLRSGEGRVIDLGNFTMLVKATDESTEGQLTLLEADEPPNFGPPMHIHHGIAEAFYVLAGEYRMFMEDEEFRCPAGSFVWIPAGLRHTFVVGDEPSRKLNVYLPAKMLAYFDDLSAAIAAGEATDERLAEIASRNSLEIVGQVPEGYV